MKWSEFVGAVLVDLPVDNERINVATGNPNYLTQQLVYAVIQIQQLIPFYRGGHETIYGPNDLVIDGLASIGSLPQGQQCRPLDAYYKRTGRQCVSQPLQPYPWGARFDLVCGNPRVVNCQFFMAIDPWGQQFTVFPSVGERHQISLTWEGVKTAFADDDGTPFDLDVVEAVGLFVKAKIARLVDHDLAEHGSYMTDWVRRRALLFADVQERTRTGLNADSPSQSNKCANSRSPCCNDGASPCHAPGGVGVQEDTTEFVTFGDSSGPDESEVSNTSAVSVLVKSLEPDFVLHLGDINYPNGDPIRIQDNLIKYYGLYIPASFYFAFGNHDIETDNGNTLASLFTKQSALNGGLRYFDFIPQAHRQQTGAESCHIFVLDTNQPVGPQAAWLQPLLEASDGFWNIVAMHEAPYTSDVNHAPGNLGFRLPYKTWGADLVISGHGHNYERLLVDGLPYVVTGLGGNSKRGFVDPPTTGSQFRYNSFFGASYISCRHERLQHTFYDTRGEVIDSFALQRKAAVEVA